MPAAELRSGPAGPRRGLPSEGCNRGECRPAGPARGDRGRLGGPGSCFESSGWLSASCARACGGGCGVGGSRSRAMVWSEGWRRRQRRCEGLRALAVRSGQRRRAPRAGRRPREPPAAPGAPGQAPFQARALEPPPTRRAGSPDAVAGASDGLRALLEVSEADGGAAGEQNRAGCGLTGLSGELSTAGSVRWAWGRAIVSGGRAPEWPEGLTGGQHGGHGRAACALLPRSRCRDECHSPWIAPSGPQARWERCLLPPPGLRLRPHGASPSLHRNMLSLLCNPVAQCV